MDKQCNNGGKVQALSNNMKKRIRPILIVTILLVTCCTPINDKPQNPTPNNNVDSDLIYIPAGEFQIWNDQVDNKTEHTVFLDSFYISQYEITNAEYTDCVNSGVCKAPKVPLSFTRSEYYGNHEFDNYPVVFVDWNSATSYCKWRGWRLPTETEWEKAARGTKGMKYPWGNLFDNTVANIDRTHDDTTLVGAYEKGKSPYGIYDMIGNVWEWTQDWYSDDYYYTVQHKNPQGPEQGEKRVIRGGSFEDPSYKDERYAGDPASPTYRFGWSPEKSNQFIGFRCATSP